MNEVSSTVLIIEDQSELADLVAAVLDSAGYRPLVAADGEEGLKLAREHLPALILCDCTMPGLSGEEVLGALRAGARTASLPIVLMSGKPAVELAGHAPDAVLAKPFHMKDMIEVVRSLVPENSACVDPSAGELVGSAA
jgi:DNA-binding response OmpR family regulator